MMKHTIQKFVLFGATGDLSQRMVWPSLYHLCREKLVPPTLTFVGSARNAMPNEEFRKFVEESLRKHVLPDFLKEDALADLLTRITYAPFQAGDGSAAGTEPLQKALAGSNRILYFMATSPKFYGPTARSLAAAGLACEHCRIILEKPIGTDFASSVAINEAVGSVFHEDRIFRIDHYLGKEAVQNLLALRFANSLFEPLWNSSSIDNVQITVAETVGLEGRTGYYDEAGALRDMIQNHVLQLMALVAMEPPHLFEPNEVRNEKTKVIRSLRPISSATVGATTVRGQYAAGSAGGVAVPGYNQEQGAKGNSETETFVALRAEIDNWRWAGVPFYLRTGKRMQARRTDIAIQFKTVPHNIFAADEPNLQANRLVIKLQPQESVVLQILSKQPGLEGVRLREVPLELSLPKDESGGRQRIAYERLLLDALKGNTTLFVRRDEVEAAWNWIDGIQTSWKSTRQTVKPYPAGTWGPTAAIALTERHGHSWYE
ncbi:MAG: glucose-6-phosphate dehydrogenase [Steroidobacteraceae bacterium]|jgi:glucose-6-phosphate 1-dehydrogenase|nr:glucose-6-phosphate dehydrogenase [Steroidobacteraceae bacterium]